MLRKIFPLGMVVMTLIAFGVITFNGLRNKTPEHMVVVEQTRDRLTGSSPAAVRDTVSPDLRPSPATAAMSPALASVVNAKPVLDLASIYLSRDPYPQIVALREARQKGTFASAFELTSACYTALIAIARPPNYFGSNNAGPDEQLAARLRAKQEIEVRCSRFTGQDTLDLRQPLTDDAYGNRYRQAINVLGNGANSSREMEAVSEMIAQGMVVTDRVTMRLREPRTWRGQIYKRGDIEFDTAASIAIRLATSNQTANSVDLRDLVDCYRGAPCTDFLSGQLGYIPADRRAAVEAMARDMAATLRAGEISAWQPKQSAPPGG